MSDTLFSAADVVGKTLYANQNVTAMDGNGQPLFTINKNNIVGIVYSWVTRPNGDLWWMFYDGDNEPYYVKHAVGLFNIEDLRQQGVLTPIEKAAAELEANTPWYEKLAAQLGGTVQTLLIIGVVVWGGLQVYKTTRRDKRNPSSGKYRSGSGPFKGSEYIRVKRFKKPQSA